MQKKLKFKTTEDSRPVSLSEAENNLSFASVSETEDGLESTVNNVELYPYALHQTKKRLVKSITRMSKNVLIDENGNEIFFPTSGTRDIAIADAIAKKVYRNQEDVKGRVFTGRYEHRLDRKEAYIEIDNDSVTYAFFVGDKPMQHFGGTQNFDILHLSKPNAKTDLWVAAIPIARALALANNRSCD